MIITRTINILVLTLFLYCAYVQFNDSDAWKWILIYLSIAILPLLYLLNYEIKTYTTLLCISLAIILLLNFSSLTDWLAAGKPDFIDYEPTTIDVVEGIREFLGLVIAFITSIIYLIFIKKKERS